MEIDLHCHAKISKKSAFDMRRVLRLCRFARRNGLCAVALTEHFNTTGFEQIHQTLKSRYRYAGDCYEVEGIRVFCGMEVDVTEGGHVILIGSRDAIADLNLLLEPHREKERFIPFARLLDEADRREMIKIGAHPFRNDRSLGQLSGDLLRRLDLLEVNGSDIGKTERVRRLAQELGMRVAAGSDTHHWLQAGCVRNRFADDCTTVGQLRNALLSEWNRIVVSPWIHLQLCGARLIKKALKALRCA